MQTPRPLPAPLSRHLPSNKSRVPVRIHSPWVGFQGLDSVPRLLETFIRVSQYFWVLFNCLLQNTESAFHVPQAVPVTPRNTEETRGILLAPK